MWLEVTALLRVISFSLSLSLSLSWNSSVRKVSFKRTVQCEMDIRAETSIELENGIHSFLTNMTKELNVNIDMVNKKYIWTVISGKVSFIFTINRYLYNTSLEIQNRRWWQQPSDNTPSLFPRSLDCLHAFSFFLYPESQVRGETLCFPFYLLKCLPGPQILCQRGLREGGLAAHNLITALDPDLQLFGSIFNLWLR